jgi:hypothetical protein
MHHSNIRRDGKKRPPYHEEKKRLAIDMALQSTGLHEAHHFAVVRVG